MVVISKHLFYEKIGPEMKCRTFCHPWTDNCLLGNSKAAVDYLVPGIVKFFFPVYLIKVLIDHKKVDKNYIKKLLKAYFFTILFGSCYAYGILNGVCISSKIRGRLHYYNFGLISGLLGGAALFFESVENQYLNASLWLSLAIEALVLNSYYFNIVKPSASRELLVFMLSNSLYMYVLTTVERKTLPRTLWFYVPNIKRGNKLSLKQCCFEFVKYFQVGFALNTARFVFSRGKNSYRNVTETVVQAIFNKNSYKYGAFFGSYVAIFNFVLTFLQNHSKLSLGAHAAIAGLVAGTSYGIKPTVNLLAMLATTLLQTLWAKYVKIPKSCEFLPRAVPLFMICNAILLHNRFASTESCPKYFSKLTTVASSGYVDRQLSMAHNLIFNKK